MSQFKVGDLVEHKGDCSIGVVFKVMDSYLGRRLLYVRNRRGEWQDWSTEYELVDTNNDLLARALKALAEYEAWEADLIVNGDWSGEFVRLKVRQYEAMMTLQKRRNVLVREARDRGLLPTAGGMEAADAVMRELVNEYHHPAKPTPAEEASK